MTEIKALKKEVEQLRKELLKKAVSETMLTDLAIHRGSVTMQMEGGACKILAECFAQQLAESGAENYIETTFHNSASLPGEKIVVTIQRCSGKTPHQLRIDAETKLYTVMQSRTVKRI